MLSRAAAAAPGHPQHHRGPACFCSSTPSLKPASRSPASVRRSVLSGRLPAAPAPTAARRSLAAPPPSALSSSSLLAAAPWLLPPVSASAGPLVAMHFTPVTALIGGLALGVAAVGKLAITGRILGISGALKGWVVRKHITPWRVWFTAGLVGGGLLCASITPGAFDVLPASFSVPRAVLGGLLVGVGAGLGNGCTSGHGICGNARLSLRSAVYTAVFMAAGMASSTLTHSAEAAGISTTIKPPLLLPGSDVANSGALLVAAALLSLLGLARVAQQGPDSTKAASLATELVSGAIFACGLVFTGMVRPTKVIAFLSPTLPCWDLTLMFVMGGALLVALPGFQMILRKRGGRDPKPFAAERFELPTADRVDAKLLVGGALFGVGWGLTGMCPGPAVVAAVAAPAAPVLGYVAAMMAGLGLQGLLAPSGSCKPATA